MSTNIRSNQVRSLSETMSKDTLVSYDRNSCVMRFSMRKRFSRSLNFPLVKVSGTLAEFFFQSRRSVRLISDAKMLSNYFYTCRFDLSCFELFEATKLSAEREYGIRTRRSDHTCLADFPKFFRECINDFKPPLNFMTFKRLPATFFNISRTVKS